MKDRVQLGSRMKQPHRVAAGGGKKAAALDTAEAMVLKEVDEMGYVVVS